MIQVHILVELYISSSFLRVKRTNTFLILFNMITFIIYVIGIIWFLVLEYVDCMKINIFRYCMFLMSAPLSYFKTLVWLLQYSKQLRTWV